MKKIVYTLLLSFVFMSCSNEYVDVKSLEEEDNFYTLYGDKFDGVAVTMTSKNIVRDMITFDDGYPIKIEEYSRREGDFEWIDLDNGSKTKLSDVKLVYIDIEIKYRYYDDGSYKQISEMGSENGLFPWYYNGKTEYFDEEGKLTETVYYEYGEKIDKPVD